MWRMRCMSMPKFCEVSALPYRCATRLGGYDWFRCADLKNENRPPLKKQTLRRGCPREESDARVLMTAVVLRRICSVTVNLCPPLTKLWICYVQSCNLPTRCHTLLRHESPDLAGPFLRY